MFPMTDTVRDAMQTQGELAKTLTGQAMDFQVESMKLAQKQMNQGFEAAQAVVETQVKAAKAMQAAVLDSVAKSKDA